MPKYSVGFVYVMSNSSMPGIVKVGKTSRMAEDRAQDLRTTGVALPFDIEFRAATSHIEAVEKEAHAMLASARVSPKREFFRIAPSDAIDTVKDALLSVAGITAWESTEPHAIRRGDRVALTAEAGDLFVVLAYPSLLAKRAEAIDFWQAHSDGDLLELMGTADPGHVAGVSDGDQGGEEDPVPHLDRARQVPNGLINGRERLVSGDRLLWFRPMANGESCNFVMFEIRDHCQVVSRTWDLQLSTDGWPLLLNVLTWVELPPCVERGTRAALRMSRPRAWAPRSPDSADGWAQIGGDPQPPEFWLPQLNKPQRRPGKRR